MQAETGCNDCPPGTFSASTGNDEPSDCNSCTTPGEYQNVNSGQSACLTVVAGFENSGATTQIPCSRGKFGQDATSGCVDCPKGWFTNTTHATECTACGIGESTEAAGSARCQRCPAGQAGTPCESLHPGSSASGRRIMPMRRSVASALPVSTKTNQSKRPACRACQESTRRTPTAASVRSATSTHFQTKLSSRNVFSALPARAPRSKKGQASCTDCSAGRFGASCDQCPSGFYRSTEHSTTACRACDAGKYQQRNGTTLCLPCVPGKYQSNENATTCHLCPEGFSSNSTNALACNQCPIGSGTNGNTGAASCVGCSAGEFGDGCSSCALGKYRGTSDTDTSKCNDCPEGWYQDEKKQASCLPCLPGTFSDADGAHNCTLCLAGKKSASAEAASCANCTSGTSPAGSAFCDACEAGKFMTTEVGNTVKTCASCPAGYSSIYSQAKCDEVRARKIRQ